MKQMNYNNKYCKTLLVAIVLNMLLVFTAQAQPGTLDSSFGINGIATVEGFGFVRATALQPDGKIIVVGQPYDDNFIIVARFNTDGTPDEHFGHQGILHTNLYPTHQFHPDDATDVVVQPDGKIVVVGDGYYENDYGDYQVNVLVIRYNTDGSMDESFGDRGAVISDFGNSFDAADKVALQADGKIVVGGTSSFVYYFVAVYNADGSADAGFGAGKGWIKGSLSEGPTHLTSLAVQQDAKIVISCNVNDNASIVRFKMDGTRDSSFGVYGVVKTDPTQHYEVKNIVIQPDRKIIAVGYSYPNITNLYTTAIVLRYEYNGKYDTGFGEAGIVKMINDTANVSAKDIVLQEDGKILITGGYSNGGIGTGILIRLNKDGSLNDHFGNEGVVQTILTNLASLLIQPDGKVVARGSITTGSSFTYTLSRFKADNEPSPRFAKIKKWLHKHGFTWDDFPHLAPGGSIHVERSANGSIFNTIASIAAHNNSQPYSFEDPAPLAGTNYYRLTATAADGSNVSSNVIAIGNNDAALVKVFPNPVKNILQVTGLSATQKTILTITDLSGARSAVITVTGSSYNWNIGQFKAGSYILRIENGDLVVSKMFIKE